MSSMTELTKSEAEELVEAFSLFDLDRDGRISARELGTVMRALGQNPTETAIRKMLKSIGKSEKEFLDFDEYKNLIASHVIPPDEVERRLVEAFRFFDKDNSGTISVRELKRILTMYGETITEQEASEILKDLDKDNDGKLLYSEISSFLCKRMMLE